jgi:hypothetical protein
MNPVTLHLGGLTSDATYVTPAPLSKEPDYVVLRKTSLDFLTSLCTVRLLETDLPAFTSQRIRFPLPASPSPKPHVPTPVHGNT